MAADSRPLAARIGLLAVSFLATATSAAGYGHRGSTIGSLLNRYFLPQNAQVSGLSELIFVVIIPLIIVAILLYLGLNTFLPQRQSQALGVLLALFIIPSGGYRLISGILLTVFGLGNTAPGAPGGVAVESLPIVNQLGLPLTAAVLAFVLMGISFQQLGDNEYQTFEFISSFGIAYIIYAGLGGGTISFTALFSSIIIFGIGAYIFQHGISQPTQSSDLVSFVGVIIMGWAIMSSTFLPGPVRGIGTILSALGVIGFIGVVLILAIIVGVAGWWVYNHAPVP